MQSRYKIHSGDSRIIIPFYNDGAMWLLLVHGIPVTWNRIMGEDHSIVVKLNKEKHSSRRCCDYRLAGNPFDNSIPSYVCISSKYVEAMPNKVPVKLSVY